MRGFYVADVDMNVYPPNPDAGGRDTNTGAV